MTIHRTATLRLITLVASGGVLLSACSEGSSGRALAPLAPAPADVRVVHPDARDIPIVVRATGTFAADESSEVAPPVSGQVVATEVDVGGFVQTGQVLVRLDPRDATLHLQQARASLQQAEAEAQRARVEADRNARLVESGDISRSSYDRLKAQVAVADASVAQAHAQVAGAQKALDDTTVRAPFAGYVSERKVAMGEYVTTSSTVATIVRIQPIKLNLRVPEADAARLRPGLVVHVQVPAYPDQTFGGTVSALNVALDPSSRAMTVEATFPNRDSRLTPGMFGSAEIHLTETEPAIFIPAQAVVPTPDGESSAVYVVDDDEARLRIVETGDIEDGAVRILVGLDSGTQVVVDGIDRLFDGAPVRVSP